MRRHAARPGMLAGAGGPIAGHNVSAAIGDATARFCLIQTNGVATTNRTPIGSLFRLTSRSSKQHQLGRRRPLWAAAISQPMVMTGVDKRLAGLVPCRPSDPAEGAHEAAAAVRDTTDLCASVTILAPWGRNQASVARLTPDLHVPDVAGSGSDLRDRVAD